jgi:hypothetical protein
MKHKRCRFSTNVFVAMFHCISENDICVRREGQSNFRAVKCIDRWIIKLAYCMRILQTFMAEYTSYFSAASANHERVTNGVPTSLGWCSG